MKKKLFMESVAGSHRETVTTHSSYPILPYANAHILQSCLLLEIFPGYEQDQLKVNTVRALRTKKDPGKVVVASQHEVFAVKMDSGTGTMVRHDQNFKSLGDRVRKEDG